MAGDLATVGADGKKLATDAHLLAEGVPAVVKNQEQYDVAAEYLLRIKAQASLLEKKRVELKAPLLAATRGIDLFFKGPLDVLAQVERELKDRIYKFLAAKAAAEEAERKRKQAIEDEKAEQERQRLMAIENERRAKAEAERREAERLLEVERAERRRLQAIEDEKAEQERRRLRAEAERLEGIERQKKLEEMERVKAARAKSEDLDRLRLDRLQQEDKAKETERKADVTAEQVATVASVAVVVAPKVQEMKGVVVRKTWQYRVVDVLKVPREYLVPDSVKLGKLARTEKEDARVPGVEFFAIEDIAATADGAKK